MAQSLKEMLASGEAVTDRPQSLRALVDAGHATIHGGPSAFDAAATGTVQGATLGFADELGGLYEKLMGNGGVKLGDSFKPNASDTPGIAALKNDALARQAMRPTDYESARDSLRQGAHEAQAAHPVAFGGGQILGSLAIPVPGVGAGTTALARVGRSVATGAGLGALTGIGTSEGQDAGEVAGDALTGGLWGAGGGLVAGTASEGARLLNGRAARGVQEAQGDALRRATTRAEEAHASAVGTQRNMVGQASRDLEVMAREAEALPAGHPLKAQLHSYLDSPDGLALREMVARNKLVSGPQRIADVARLGQEAEAAAANMSPEAVQAAADASLQNPLRTQILPRVRTYANRTIPQMVGGAVGGAPGMVVGGLVANTIGRPTTALANAAQSPSVRNALWGLIERGTSAAPELNGLVNSYRSPIRSGMERGVEMMSPKMMQVEGLLRALRGQSPEDEGLAGR